MKKKEIILKEGTYTCEEMAELIDLSKSSIKNNPTSILKKLSIHCTASRKGTGEGMVYELSNVPTEPIPKKEFGKDPSEINQRKERKDKGMSRDEYNTIKEEFKPLIYNVLLKKPNYSYTATINEWLLEAELVEEEYLKGRKLLTEGLLAKDRFAQEFLNTEGDSLRRCFLSALESMEKTSVKGKKNKGRIKWYKKKIAIDMDGKKIELNDQQVIEVENIETELLTLFKVSSRVELAFKNKAKLKEFDIMFRMILEDRYGFAVCYTAYQVIAKLGAKKSTIDKNIKEAKEFYGLIDTTCQTIGNSKTNIYENRKRRAEIRYQNKIDKINSTYREDLDSEMCDDDFVKFLRELDLSDVGTLEDYMSKWVVHYSVYINSKINIQLTNN